MTKNFKKNEDAGEKGFQRVNQKQEKLQTCNEFHLHVM